MMKNSKCYLCETKLDKTAIGMNKKLLGREVKRFLCLSCISNHLEISVDDLLSLANEFKEQGCELFL